MSGKRKSGVVLFDNLKTCEGAIEGYLVAYQVAGQALLQVREAELWREGKYASFEDYVEKRWGFTASRASQLEKAGRLVQHIYLSDEKLRLPANEGQAREVLRIRAKRGENDEKTWQRRVNAWQIVLDKANGAPLTAKFIRSVINRFIGGGDKVKQKKPPSHDDMLKALLMLLRVKDEVHKDEMESWQLLDDPFFIDVREWMNSFK